MEEKSLCIKINSDAYPERLKSNLRPISDVHQYITNMDKITLIENIYFNTLTRNHISELSKLYKEWFPVNYSPEYFHKIFSTIEINKGIAIGAFYSFNGNSYIIGAILCEYKNDFAFRHSCPYDLINRCCLSKFINPFEYGYISTIGVCDEFRRYGLGTKLLNELIKNVSLRRQCIAIYLHVIEYNQSALKFYFTNNFDEVNTIYGYYYIDEVRYNAKVFLKVLSENVKIFNNTEYNYKDYTKMITKKFKSIICCEF